VIRRWTLLTTIAICALAQDQPASADPRDLAWGAYLAANDQQKNLIPSILPLLRHEDSAVRLAAIDAPIRLDADVPEQDLAPLLRGYWLDSALIFVSRDPRRHADLLMRLLDGPLRDQQWVAITSILYAVAPPGYAARLYKDWTLQYTIQVWDTPSGYIEGCCSGWGGGGILVDAAGFPPL
jgi:hypothetical protein